MSLFGGAVPAGRQRTYRIVFLVYLFAAAGLLLPGGGDRVDLLIFHTNDMHGWIMPRSTPAGEKIGGMAVLAAYLSRQRAPYLLLDAGDIYQGTPEGTLTRGEAVTECMNALRYDAAAVGNHEFDHGVENLAFLTERAQFPFLSANVSHRRLDGVKPWILKEVEGVKVGIFGLTTSRTGEMSFERNVAGVDFEDEASAALRAVRELREQGADIVVALTHLGLERPSGRAGFFGDRALAREIDGIDLIIGGHTHTPLHRMEIVDGTRIVQAGSGLRSVGRVRLMWEPDARRVVDARYSLVRLDAERWGQDASVRSLVDYFAETASREIGVNLNEIVGTAAQELTRDYRAESPLGNWQTDAMRAAAEADIALQNSGGIRENMPAGPVRVRDLYQISPFGNTLVVMRLRGQTLWELLEHGVSGPQGILQVSGLRMEYDPRRPAGYRLLSVSVKGAPLEMDKWYVVATNSFLAQGGDGYEGFKRGWNIVDTKKTLLDVQIEAMKKGGKASAEREGRIVPL